MNRFFTSDLHFGHANILKYCNRPFSNVNEMDEALINNWNARVTEHDIVYILGDVFFCDVNRAQQIMLRLKGKKRLVLGNHDKIIRNQHSLQMLFDKILPELHEESFEGHKVIMCHYPLLTWNRAHHGSYMLHGHQHNKISHTDVCRRYDVGVDANHYAPVFWSDIKRDLDRVTAVRVGRENPTINQKSGQLSFDFPEAK